MAFDGQRLSTNDQPLFMTPREIDTTNFYGNV